MAIVNGQTFFRFDPTEDIVSDRQIVSSGLWSGDAGTLLTAYLNGPQSSSTGQYYLDVLNVASNSVAPVPEVQFSIAYGHKFGSGSLIGNDLFPSEVIYSQYKNILLEPTDQYFTLNGINKSHILVINVARSRFRQSIDPGNWQLSFSGSNGQVYTVIDDSGQTLSPTVGKAGRVFNLVSGSIAAGTGSNGQNFGLVYPDMGFLIFDPDVLFLSASVSGNLSHSNANDSNQTTVFNAISGAMVEGNGFIARRQEEVASTHYFVRVKSAAFNFSNNPTFVTGTLGDLFWSQMIKNPVVYPTTVGLYDDNNQLLAVAKLSQPLKKTFTNEALIRVKLDF